MAFIADAVPVNARGMASGTFRTFFDFGGLMGPIVLTTLVERIGYPQGYPVSFYVGSGLMALSLLLVLQLKETREIPVAITN